MRFLFPLFSLLLIFVQCSRYDMAHVEYDTYEIEGEIGADSSLQALISTYKKDLDAEMQEKLVFNKNDLYKSQPESGLGNFMAGVCRETTENELNEKVDLALLNHGGIRVRSISKGWVTKGKIYELMPFDNFLVALKIRGDTLRMVLDQVAQYGGWPISGAGFQIKEGKADSIYIRGKLIQPDQYYMLATSDYLAKGGDNMKFFTQYSETQTGVLLRDALIQSCKTATEQGDSLYFPIQGKIKSR